MRVKSRMLHLLMALVMLVSYLTIPTAIADDTVTVTLNVTNTPVRGDVVLEKKGLQLVRFQDEKDANGYSIMKPVYENGYLAGAVFELHAAEDIVGKEGTVFYRKDQLIEKLTTTKTGSVKSSLLPLGKYYLVETSAPDGYVYSTERCNFTLSAIDKKTANTYLPVRVSLMKKKEQTKINNLENGMVHQVIEVVAGEGFVFGLYNSSVITYADNQKLPANTLVATAVTDKNGNLTISGMYPHGNYYLKELAVPDGWKLSTEKFPVTLTSANKASNENTIVVKLSDPILNELIYIPVTITKTDITGAEKLPGALIEVYDENRKLIYREYTNKNGEIPDMYILTATGNSMIDAGIHEGDMILVRRQETANIGDIVVVWVENEGNTLKRFYRKGKTIILKPENSDMEDIRVKEEDCRIQGVAIWVLKKVGD